MKNLKYVIYVVIIGLIGWGVYAIATAPKIPESEIISKQGIHWHAHLSIIIDGKEVDIPTDIGVTGRMGTGGDPMEIHTHTPDGILHLEFAGLVTKEQTKLKNFFTIWGKDFTKDSILGRMAGNGHTIKMYVNGVENTEFENYEVTGVGTYDTGSEKVDDIKIVYE